MTHLACLTSRLVAGTALLALATVGPTLAAPPARDDPLVHSITPWEAREGQQLMVTGVNFGSAPEVRFKGILAPIVADRSDVGRIIVIVPGGDTDGPLTVTNTDTMKTSNPARFTRLTDPYVEACSIGGSVTDPSGSGLAGAIVAALDPTTGTFAGAAVSAAVSGGYSISLPSAGTYDLLFFPPASTSYVRHGYAATCAGTQDHQFAIGLELSARVISDTAAPIANAFVGAEGSGGFGTETLTGATGEFFLYVPADNYTVEVVGPVGGRQVATQVGPVFVTGDTYLGDIVLETGVLVSGELRWRDDGESGPLGGAWLATFEIGGARAGVTPSIADGSFHLPTAVGPSQVLFVAPEVFGLLELSVHFLDVAGDVQLEHPFTVYSSAGQLPRLPTIAEPERLDVQAGRRLSLGMSGIRGTSVEIFFPDGVGGRIAGENTYAELERGGLVTTVPGGAASGNAVVSVDGVDGPGYPLNLLPGVYDPGPFVTSGVVDDGSAPVENAFVGIFGIDCDDEYLIDYDVTDASGAYAVQHGAGDFALFVLPTISSGLARAMVPLFGLTGGGIQNVTLAQGNVLTARCVDSGIGPVGSNDPLPDCEVGAEGVDLEHDDWLVTGDDGTWRLNLPSGTYEGILEAPLRSRYVNADVSFFPITQDVDLGDATLDSGYFIEGRIVDPSGVGLAGIEITAFETFYGTDMGRTHTVGSDGSFRMAVPTGTYHLFPSVHPDHEFWVAPVYNVVVGQDLLLYPDLQALEAGHVQGTVVDGFAAPIDELPVAAYHEQLGFARQTDTCPDGTYDLKVPAGDYVIQARPSFDGLCLADEFFDDHYEGCGADLVSLTVPGTVTGIDFALAPAGSIAGTVVGASGAMPDIAVCATNGVSNPTCYSGCTTTGFDGRFELSNVPVASDYRVEASGPGQPLECWDGHPDCVDYDPVAVGNCIETSRIQFHAPAAPGPVPDGAHVAGTAMSAGRGALPGEILIEWQPTCDADDHAIYFGPLGDFSTHIFAVCDAGMSGSYSIVPPGGDLYWVVVGQNGALEGSYGYRGNLTERPDAAWCGHIQDLTATCVP